MNTIRVVGQAITSTNYATNRAFNFNPDMVRQAAENYLASGVDEIEIPQGVLDPEDRFPDTGVDQEKMAESLRLLPGATRVTATYLGDGHLGDDNAAYLVSAKRTIDALCRHFPAMSFAMLHPASKKHADPTAIQGIVRTWAQLAEYTAKKHAGFQVGFHNHYDSSGETADQVLSYLEAIRKADVPSLRWAPDTGHCHGMKDQYLTILDGYAYLIGNFFHIKTRIPAFDSLHEKEKYRPDRDIWNNTAEMGKGLYGGFVCCADPEIETPLAQVFRTIREKARPEGGIVRGSLEIDVPRQHPRLEILCAVLYLKRVHGVETGMALDYREIVERVFPV